MQKQNDLCAHGLDCNFDFPICNSDFNRVLQTPNLVIAMSCLSGLFTQYITYKKFRTKIDKQNRPKFFSVRNSKHPKYLNTIIKFKSSSKTRTSFRERTLEYASFFHRCISETLGVQ